jgi:uncharacterized protein
MSETETAGPSSDRTRVRRYHWLAKYDRDTINAIIDSGIVAQVGYVFDGSPFVTPTCHWRIDDHVYWHGSAASRMLKTLQQGVPVCFTVTHLDGVVFSRAAFNHNILYRSVMALGTAELLDDDAKKTALAAFTDRLAPGLWAYARPPAETEWRAVKVFRLKLDEVSAKVASGLPEENDEDYAADLWAGHVPLRLVQDAPVADPKLAPGVEMPGFIKRFHYAGVR